MGYIVDRTGSNFQENTIGETYLFNTSQTWTVSGTGYAGLDSNIAYVGDNSLKLINDAPTIDLVASNSSQSTIITYDGDYLFSFYMRKQESLQFFELEVNTFTGVSLTNTQSYILGSEDADEDVNGYFQRFVSDEVFTFTKGVDVTFTFNLKGKSGTALANTTVWLDGFKLEKISTDNTMPSLYSLPSTTITNNPPINFVEVNSLSDLPTPVSGAIILEDGYTYKFNYHGDLEGSYLDATDAIVNIFGNSSETSSITSTGLAVGQPLIVSNTTIKIGAITLKDVDTGMELNKDTVMALDWLGVNFVNIPNLWNIGDFDNMILNLCTVSACNNGIFTGEFETFAISESPLIGDGNAGSVLNFTSTVNCTRRIRIEKCPIVAFGSTTGITVDNSVTIDSEQFIMNTNNFSGGSTYLGGLDYTSVKTAFKGNTGITNTNKGAVLTVTTDAVTVIATQDVWVDLAGATTITKAEHIDSPADGQLRSLDTQDSEYNLVGSILLDGTANDVIEIRATIFRNATSTFEPQDIFRATINSNIGANDIATISLFDRISLSNLDIIKIEGRNITSTNNFTSVEGSSKFSLTGI